ncbi:MAG: hypothetical protein WB729_21290 [Candidatus Sulfotelmatobacter sp.]
MKVVSRANKATLMKSLARTVGHAAGKIVGTTQGLATSAAAMLHGESQGENPATEAPPPNRSARKRAVRRTSKKPASPSSKTRPSQKQKKQQPKAATKRAVKKPRRSAAR